MADRDVSLIPGDDPPENAMVGTRQQAFQVRLPPDVIKQIDALIQDKKYTTRNDFIKQAVITRLNYEEHKRNMRRDLIDLIRTDHDLRRDIIQSISQAALEQLRE